MKNKSQDSKKIVFVRHAHRHKLQPDENNGLSEKGEGQVLVLVQAYKESEIPSAQIFWTSPKKRCVDTIEPLCESAHADLKTEKLLDEQAPEESNKEFLKRLEKLIKVMEQVDQTIYLCSHGDVIPEAINLLTGRAVDIAKGQAIVLIQDGSKWSLE